MTYGDLRAITYDVAKVIGMTDSFECEVVPGPHPASADILTSPLTQHERDLMWGRIRDLVPVGIAVNLRPLKTNP